MKDGTIVAANAGDEDRGTAAPTFVFVHGFLGFEATRPVMRIVPYFRGVAGAMGAMGITCHFPQLPPAGAVAERARILADRLDRLAADRLVLVGHSMGGLDARHLARYFDPQRRVRTIVTLSTPHRGTAVADWLLTGTGALHRLAQRYWRPGLDDLTQEACARRNEGLSDRPDVEMISYAAARPFADVPFWLQPMTRSLDGPNDGLVPVASAQWGRPAGIMQADHFEMAGWSLALPRRAAGRPFAHLDLYRRIVEEVCAPETIGPG